MPIAQPPSITAHDRALPLFADRLAERRLFVSYLHAAPPPGRMLFFRGDGEALTRAPDYVDAHMNKGNALSKVSDLHLNLGDPVRAESAYLAAIAATNETLSRAPNDVIALGNKSEILRKLADLKRQRGNQSAACDRLSEAEAFLDRALTLAPNDPQSTAESARVAELLRSHCPPPIGRVSAA